MIRTKCIFLALFLYVGLITISAQTPSISLNPQDLTIKVGETQKLTATVVNDVIVSWESSNPAIATVDHNGNVTAKAQGDAVITVKGDVASATCHVKSWNEYPSVSINKDKLSLEVGQSETLTADVINEIFVKWMSSNASIATVDENGKVTAIAPGETVISAWGESKYGICMVTVKPASIHVDGVSLNKTSLTLEVDEAETLVVTISPANATNTSVLWTSSNTSVAVVDAEGNIKALAPGITTIQVTTADGDYTATCDLKVVKTGYVTLSVNARPAVGGTASGSGSYAVGTLVTVSAVPNENYTFKQWELDGVAVSTDASYTFNIDSDTELLAVFTENSANSTELLATGITAFADEGTLYIQSDKKLEDVTVYTINGQCLYRNYINSSSLTVGKLPQGLVIITVGKYSGKVLIK